MPERIETQEQMSVNEKLTTIFDGQTQLHTYYSMKQTKKCEPKNSEHPVFHDLWIAIKMIETSKHFMRHSMTSFVHCMRFYFASNDTGSSLGLNDQCQVLGKCLRCLFVPSWIVFLLSLFGHTYTSNKSPTLRTQRQRILYFNFNFFLFDFKQHNNEWNVVYHKYSWMYSWCQSYYVVKANKLSNANNHRF